jgi:hypothetical protein
MLVHAPDGEIRLHQIIGHALSPTSLTGKKNQCGSYQISGELIVVIITIYFPGNIFCTFTDLPHFQRLFTESFSLSPSRNVPLTPGVLTLRKSRHSQTELSDDQ